MTGLRRGQDTTGSCLIPLTDRDSPVFRSGKRERNAEVLVSSIRRGRKSFDRDTRKKKEVFRAFLFAHLNRKGRSRSCDKKGQHGQNKAIVLGFKG